MTLMATIQSPDASAFTAALTDPEIEQRVRRIVRRALRDYEWIMEYGSESERLALLRTALPNLLRAMASKDDQQRDAEQRRAYEDLRSAFRLNVKENVVGE